MASRKNVITFDESGDCSTEVHEQFNKNVVAFEQAKWGQPFQVLVDSGISLPQANELAETELKIKLWEIIIAQSLAGVYLEHTDHLNDRELYTILCNDVLKEEIVFQSGDMNLAYHIDVIGSGSDEDNKIYLKYYADDDERSLWAKEFPDDLMHSREQPAFDRDSHLPKAGIEKKLTVH